MDLPVLVSGSLVTMKQTIKRPQIQTDQETLVSTENAYFLCEGKASSNYALEKHKTSYNKKHKLNLSG